MDTETDSHADPVNISYNVTISDADPNTFPVCVADANGHCVAVTFGYFHLNADSEPDRE
jgi:hypothetical protein